MYFVHYNNYIQIDEENRSSSLTFFINDTWCVLKFVQYMFKHFILIMTIAINKWYNVYIYTISFPILIFKVLYVLFIKLSKTVFIKVIILQPSKSVLHQLYIIIYISNMFLIFFLIFVKLKDLKHNLGVNY